MWIMLSENKQFCGGKCSVPVQWSSWESTHTSPLMQWLRHALGIGDVWVWEQMGWGKKSAVFPNSSWLLCCCVSITTVGSPRQPVGKSRPQAHQGKLPLRVEGEIPVSLGFTFKARAWKRHWLAQLCQEWSASGISRTHARQKVLWDVISSIQITPCKSQMCLCWCISTMFTGHMIVKHTEPLIKARKQFLLTFCGRSATEHSFIWTLKATKVFGASTKKASPFLDLHAGERQRLAHTPQSCRMPHCEFSPLVLPNALRRQQPALPSTQLPLRKCQLKHGNSTTATEELWQIYLLAALQKSARKNSLLNIREGLLKGLPIGFATSNCFIPDLLGAASRTLTKYVVEIKEGNFHMLTAAARCKEIQTLYLKHSCFTTEFLFRNTNTARYRCSLGCCPMTNWDKCLPCCCQKESVQHPIFMPGWLPASPFPSVLSHPSFVLVLCSCHREPEENNHKKK